jgi:sensor c-di-GMP phosphodiesterase-like protein
MQMITYTIPRSHCRHLDIDRHIAHSVEYIKYVRYHTCVFICTSMKKCQDTKQVVRSQAVSHRRTYNALAKRKSINKQTMIHKALQRKLNN